jgi:hypothetical protein
MNNKVFKNVNIYIYIYIYVHAYHRPRLLATRVHYRQVPLGFCTTVKISALGACMTLVWDIPHTATTAFATHYTVWIRAKRRGRPQYGRRSRVLCRRTRGFAFSLLSWKAFDNLIITSLVTASVKTSPTLWYSSIYTGCTSQHDSDHPFYTLIFSCEILYVRYATRNHHSIVIFNFLHSITTQEADWTTASGMNTSHNYVTPHP